MEWDRRTTVRNVRADDRAVAGNNVAIPAVHGPNDATVFKSTVREMFKNIYPLHHTWNLRKF